MGRNLEVKAKRAEMFALRGQGLTPVQIAERLGVHRATVSRALRLLHPTSNFDHGWKPRAARLRGQVDRQLSERELRALAKQIDGTWYPPGEAS